MDTTGERGHKDVQSKRRKYLFLFGAPIVLGLIVIGLLFLIQSPAVINHLGAALEDGLGYRVSVRDLSLSPKLRGEISGLEIRGSEHGGLLLRSERVVIQSDVTKSLKGEIESIILTEPRLRFKWGEKAGKGDLSFLRKLPPVHLLTIQGGEVELSSSGFPSTIKLTGVNLNIRDFSPRRGGMITFESTLEIASPKGEGLTGMGRCRGSINLTSLYPVTSGKGSVELQIDSASYGSVMVQKLVLTLPFDLNRDTLSLEDAFVDLTTLTYRTKGQQVALTKVRFGSPVLYDLKSAALALNSIEARILALGGFKGALRVTLRGDFPWKASVETSTVDLGAVLALIKPLLPQEYRDWGIQGKGAMEASLEGTYSQDRLAGGGTLSLDIRQGGFSSPDGTKAGQGITGKVTLKLRIPPSDGKGDFAFSSELGEGEVLWGKFYKDLSGRRVGILSEGSFVPDSPRILEFRGTADIFATGQYSFSASFPGEEWRLSLNAEKISHNAVLSVFFQDYLSENFPALKGLEAGGTTDMEVATVHDRDVWRIRGIVTLNDAFLKIPGEVFTLAGLSLSLPFDLFYPDSASLPEALERTGKVSIKAMAKERLSVEDLTIPLVLSRNVLLVPEDIKVKIAGGDVVLFGVKGEEILSAGRSFALGLRIENMDLGSLTGSLSDMPLSGVLEADFPSISYKRGFLKTEGRIVAKVFGGEVEGTNLFGSDLFSPQRRLGGDLFFKGMNLEQVTEKIEIGKITGVIEGSVRNLEMEYGQPSRFMLDLQSVETKGVDQTVSVDAVQNLSILGTGSEGMSAVLGRGLGRFFKKFAYSRIGFICTLENDVFTIRGKIHEGGTEYLIRRAFLRGIDVVNQNPQNKISFKDMQERIGRLYRPGETGGPVIK